MRVLKSRARTLEKRVIILELCARRFLGTAQGQYQATESPSTTCICPLRGVGYEFFIKAELMTRGGKAVCSNGLYYFIPL